MGKKTKIGKARKDKFYQLAKETGYRSRAAFKLIQLNKKFGFLNQSRVVVDLCAAPGGWMQVVAENTPVSSLIVGVDLVYIKPVHRCISLQEDITTDKCRQSLKKALQTWQADCVLNDGAPNVGKNWIHDAYNQSELTLHALKLATEFLRKGGWFVTKVFRSKDYFALNWVFQQLFKKVWATKPQASRHESAEIFVVCEHFVAPDKLDPKFLDPKYVFQEVQMEPSHAINLMHPEKKQRHREGYAEGDYTQFHKLKALEFIQSDDFMERLALCSMIELDDEFIANNKATTSEIKNCCADIKVLGKKDLKSLFTWRKAVLKDLQNEEKAAKEASLREDQTASADELEEVENEQEEEELEEMMAKAHEEEKQVNKRKKRKEKKLLAKKRQRLNLKMDLPGDRLDFGDETGIFSLSKIRTKKELDTVQEGNLSFMDEEIAEEDDANAEMVLKNRKLLETYDKNNKNYIDPSEYVSDEEGTEEPSLMDLDEEDRQSESEVGDNNPLVVELENKDNKARSRTASWFSKVAFEGLEKDDDEDVELENMMADYEKCGGIMPGKDNEESKDEGNQPSCTDAELVPVDKEAVKLDPVGLAMGAAMVRSKKHRREIIESGFNRYMKGEDEDLPDWFVKDEKRHSQKQMPVTKEEVQEYMLKMRAIDARPIKKLAEAKARKKKKMLRRLEKARKKAEIIGDSVDVLEREKLQQIKHIYKKAGLLSQKKPDVTYVVAKKGMGKRIRRPQGVKGPFRVVDPRMKKDHRSEKSSAGRSKHDKRKPGGKTRVRQRQTNPQKKGSRR